MEAAYKDLITEQHADMLLSHQYLFFNKEFKLVSPKSSENNSGLVGNMSLLDEKPFYVLFLLHPQNPMLAKIHHSASIKTMKDIGNKTNSSSSPLHSWFQQELAIIDKEKESFDEYFYYLKGKKLVSMVKVHENLYERWSQFSLFKHAPHHFIIYLKVLSSDSIPNSLNNSLETSTIDLFQAIPTSIMAFSIKDAFINGKQTKISYGKCLG